MKNGLLRFYLLFMLVSVALFSCENHELSHDNSGTTQNFQRKPDNRQPVEPNEAPGGQQKGKKSQRKYVARSSNWC